jgi:hypothetical protein
MKSRYSFRLILLICVIATVANAQIQLHFGVEAGVPLTDTLSSTSSSSISPSGSFFDRYNSETKRLLIGPAFRVDLQRGLGIEFDALYQRINYDHASVSSAPSFFNQSFEQTTANRWQFPLLVQYNWTLSNTKSDTKFFAELGPSISRIANSRSTISSITSSGSSTSSNTGSATGQGGTWAGITAGAGVDLSFFHRHLRPEFRYSHWFSPSAGSAIGPAAFVTGGFTSIAGVAGVISTSVVSPTFRTNQNEATFLLGLTF